MNFASIAVIMSLVGAFKKLALPKNVNSKKTSIAIVNEMQIFQISKVITLFISNSLSQPYLS